MWMYEPTVSILMYLKTKICLLSLSLPFNLLSDLIPHFPFPPPVPPVSTAWDSLVPCILPVACSLGEFGPVAGGLIGVGRVTVSTLSSIFGECWGCRRVNTVRQEWVRVVLVVVVDVEGGFRGSWEFEALPTSPPEEDEVCFSVDAQIE